MNYKRGSLRDGRVGRMCGRARGEHRVSTQQRSNQKSIVKLKKVTQTRSNTYSDASPCSLHHKSLVKPLSLYLHGSLYLISSLPSHMAYIQQEKAFRFNRIRIFWTNITKAESPMPKFKKWVCCGSKHWDIRGSFGFIWGVWRLAEFLQLRHWCPIYPTPIYLTIEYLQMVFKVTFLRMWLAELKVCVLPGTLNQLWAVCPACFNKNDMSSHSLPTFLVNVTTWSLDYNTSSEATIAAGFFKISH